MLRYAIFQYLKGGSVMVDVSHISLSTHLNSPNHANNPQQKRLRISDDDPVLSVKVGRHNSVITPFPLTYHSLYVRILISPVRLTIR